MNMESRQKPRKLNLALKYNCYLVKRIKNLIAFVLLRELLRTLFAISDLDVLLVGSLPPSVRISNR